MSSPKNSSSDPPAGPRDSKEGPTSTYAQSYAVSGSSEDTVDQVDGLAHIPTRASRASVPSLAQRVTSIGTTGTSDPNYEVDWDDEFDTNNPKNWSFPYKAMGIAILSYNTLIIVLYSTSYTSGESQIAAEFGTSTTIVTLGLTLYLIGLAVGSMFMAPLSELYGRKPVCIACLFIFTVLIIPCALAKNLATLLVVRFIAALFGSVMISTAPGMVADIVEDDQRALAMSVWSLGPVNGPVLGPIIGGFVTQYLGWRWMDWIALILSGVALVLSCIMKETYGPIILQKKAARMRKETGDSRWWCRYEQKASLSELLKINLGRPFVMAVTEPICIFWNIYIAIVYGILYLCFTAYPIVFRDIRGWSLGLSGLAFLGIGTGCVITISSEPLIRHLINSHKPDPETGKPPPEAMVAFVCICALLIPAGELWFAWTCSPASIPWIVPILAGVLFGTGNTGVFIYATNYLAGSYGVYAASALAGNSVIRSILGGVLPLVGTYMYAGIGPNWSGTLLGLLEVAIVPIPFIFYKYGYKIREKSVLIRRMQEDKQRLAGKRQRQTQQVPNLEKTEEETMESILGTVLLDVRELDESWESPYPNRELLDPTHIKKLEESYRHGTKHTAPEYRMRISITLADWQGLLNEMAERLNKEDDSLTRPTLERSIMPTQCNENGYYNFTLDAGQHRKYALLNFIRLTGIRRKNYGELPSNQMTDVTDIPPEVGQQITDPSRISVFCGSLDIDDLCLYYIVSLS
ncbi:MFS transporter [Aspergillus niger CBS 101883]|uniref:MFS transporter n=1 Tax=Aspergillus lacticoffeatus (strain CBS 101883) TaxID=1450533 RepID=UPI000D7F24A3|nr:MFS general substrate transporter [Aspergillus niger CBS 101883]PYH51788.1 MFS general substrate transporter [Aspergillus niger CBS 101883]